MNNKIFTGFLIIALSVSFWLMPVSDWIYTWKTEPRIDTFYNVSSNATEITSNVTLLKPVYDNDTATISLFSYDSGDTPVYSSYNTTARLLSFTGLAVSTNRTMEITYDVAAFEESGVFDSFAKFIFWFTYFAFILFPLAGIAYIFRDEIRGWLT